MRKAIFLTITFCLTFIMLSQAQERYIVTYDLNYVPYNDSPNTKNRVYKLYIDKDRSIFVDQQIMERFRMNEPAYAGVKRIMVNRQKFNYFDSNLIEKDKNHLLYIKNDVFEGFMAYKSDKMTMVDWQMTADTATVAGLLSQKATCELGGREWTAWFSPEIPIAEGPYKFSGLPGLIVKITSIDGEYDFEIAQFEKMEPKAYFIHQVQYVVLPRKRFDDHFNQRYLDPYSFGFKRSGGTPDMIVTVNGKEMTAMQFSEDYSKKDAYNTNTIEKFNPDKK